MNQITLLLLIILSLAGVACEDGPNKATTTGNGTTAGNTTGNPNENPPPTTANGTGGETTGSTTGNTTAGSTTNGSTTNGSTTSGSTTNGGTTAGTTTAGTTTGGTGTTPQPSVSITSFRADKNCILSGTSVVLSWQTQNADLVQLNGQTVAANGSQTVNIAATQFFNLVAVRGTTQSKTRQIAVQVRPTITTPVPTEHNLGIGEIMAVDANSSGNYILLAADNTIYKGNINTLNTAPSEIDPNPVVTNWTTVAIDPNDSNILYAGKNGRVYRSSNGGQSWSVIPVRANGSDLAVVKVLPVAQNEIWVVFSGGVSSILFGQGNVLVAPQTLNGVDFTMAGMFGEKVVVASTDEIFVVQNNNAQATPAINGTIQAFTMLEDTLYVGTSEGLFSISLANPTWNPTTITSSVTALSVDTQNHLWASTEEGLLRKDTNGWNVVLADYDPNFMMPPFFILGESLTTISEGPRDADSCPLMPISPTGSVSVPSLMPAGMQDPVRIGGPSVQVPRITNQPFSIR